MSDSLHERGRALEDLFFKNRDQQLLDAMREKMEATDGRAELKSTSGIDDDSVIDALIAVGVNAKTIATVGLIPLIAVAWADSKMESKYSPIHSARALLNTPLVEASKIGRRPDKGGSGLAIRPNQSIRSSYSAILLRQVTPCRCLGASCRRVGWGRARSILGRWRPLSDAR